MREIVDVGAPFVSSPSHSAVSVATASLLCVGFNRSCRSAYISGEKRE